MAAVIKYITTRISNVDNDTSLLLEELKKKDRERCKKVIEKYLDKQLKNQHHDTI